MIKDILKMGGCKTEKEFYQKYPTEQAFLEAFPQARPMMEQFAKGGTPEAYPQQPTMDKFFNYGPATMNIPRLMKSGGMIEPYPAAATYPVYGAPTVNIPRLFQMGGAQPADNQTNPLMGLIQVLSQQANVNPQRVLEVLQKMPKDMLVNLELLATQDPQKASETIMELLSKDQNTPFPVAQLGGMPEANAAYMKPMGNVTDQEYGGSVFNYGYFPAIMADGGSIPMNTEKTYLNERLQKFVGKLHELSDKNEAKQMEEQMLNQMGYMKKGGKILPMHQVPPGQTGSGPAPWNPYSGYGRKLPGLYEQDEFLNTTQQAPINTGFDANSWVRSLYGNPTGRSDNFRMTDEKFIYPKVPRNITNYNLPIGPNTEQGNFYSQFDNKNFLDQTTGAFPEKAKGVNIPSNNQPPIIGDSLNGGPPLMKNQTSESNLKNQNFDLDIYATNLYGDPAGRYKAPEGTFLGYDKDNRQVSINPEMSDEYAKGWRPEGEQKKNALTGVKNWWKNKSGIGKAETILNTMATINAAAEKRKTSEREEQLQEQMFNPMNQGAYEASQGDYDVNTGVFRPDSYVYPQNFPYAKLGGFIQKAQSGLEVKMKAGLGFNANQLSWPVMAGEFSEQDLKVGGTLRPVDRDEANLEAEVGETAVTDLSGDGIPEQYKIAGKRHYDGGTPLNLPDQSYIFSRDNSMKIKDKEILAEFGITNPPKGGVTPADIAKRYDLNKYKKVLLDKNSDDLERATAQANISNANLKLGKLALIQESMKGFPDGIPFISIPYLESVGIQPDMLPVSQAQPEEPDMNMAKFGGPALPKAQFGKSFELLRQTWPIKYAANKLKELQTSNDPSVREAANLYLKASKSNDLKTIDDAISYLKKTDIDDNTGHGLGSFISMFTGDIPFGFSQQGMINDMLDVLNNKKSNLETLNKKQKDITTSNENYQQAINEKNATKKQLDDLLKIPNRTTKQSDDIRTLSKKLKKLDDYLIGSQTPTYNITSFTGIPGKPSLNNYYQKTVDNSYLKPFSEVYPDAGNFDAAFTMDDESAATMNETAEPMSTDKDSSYYGNTGNNTQEVQVPWKPENIQTQKPQPTRVTPEQPVQPKKKPAATNNKYGIEKINTANPRVRNYNPADTTGAIPVRKYGGHYLPKMQTDGEFFEQFPEQSYTGTDIPYIEVQAPDIGSKFKTQKYDPAKGYYSAYDPSTSQYIPIDMENFYTRQGDLLGGYSTGLEGFKKDILSKNQAERERAAEWFQKSYNEQRSKLGLKPYFFDQEGPDPYGIDKKFGIYTWSAPGYKIKPSTTPTSVTASTTTPTSVTASTTTPDDLTYKGLQEANNRRINAPFFTEDIINMGAAFRNLMGVKKYLPWQATSPFYAADPTFESRERTLAANTEQLLIGTMGAGQYGDPQSFVGRFSGMSGQSARNAADIMADVNNRNVGTANQFELANKQAYNEFWQNKAAQATSMFDKYTIANQQFDNTKRQARDEMRRNFASAWTNRGRAATINNLYGDQFYFDPTTGIAYSNPNRDFKVSLPKEDTMPPYIKDLYDKALAKGDFTNVAKAIELWQKISGDDSKSASASNTKKTKAEQDLEDYKNTIMKMYMMQMNQAGS